MAHSSPISILLRSLLATTIAIIFIAIFSEQLLAAELVQVRVEGIDGDPLKNTEASLALPPGLIKAGTVDKLWLEHFSRNAGNKVKEALEPFSFYSSEVSTALEGNTQSGYTLRVHVTAGAPTRLSEVDVELQGPGAHEPLLIEKRDAFPLRPGELLLHEIYEKAKTDMLATARELGYLDAVFPVHEIKVNPATASAQIRLVMNSGPRYLFGETTIEGTTNYPEDLLRRYISYTAGSPFSYKALGETQLNFTASPYFKNASVIAHKEAADSLRIPVTIRGTLAPRRTIRPGVGYGTDTGFRGSLSYTDLSLFYPGHTLNTELTIAQMFQGFGTAYVIPSHRNMETMTTIQFNIQHEDVNDSVDRLMALELDRTTGLGSNRKGSVFTRLLYENYDVGLQEGNSLLLLPGLRFSQRSYDDLIRPAKGYHYALETLGTHKALGSDASLIQFSVETGAVMTLPWRLSLHGRGKGGITLLDDPFEDLPTSLRFFAGGDTSVRGYSYKSLGPKDDSGDVIGGKNLLQGSIELERALFDKWAVSVFYDAGNAFDTFSNLHIYQGAGVGVHYYTPIGGINLNLARQIGVTEPTFRFHVTIGFQL